MSHKKPQIDSVLYLEEQEEAPRSVNEFCKQNAQLTDYWLHLHIENHVATKWLREESGIETVFVDSMLAKKVRPRLVIHDHSLLLILRVPQTTNVEEHEELRSIRIYADKNRVISSSLYYLPVLATVLERFREADLRDMKAVDLLLALVSEAVRGVEVLLEDLEEETDLYEQQVLDVGEDPEDNDIALLALNGLHLRRCLAPQRESISRLTNAELAWMNGTHKKRLREVYERVSRQLEETEVIRERTRIIREQRNGHLAEQVNYRLYVFSVVAVLFLPLGFLTGLLGVNLGGIPGADSPEGFGGFCALLVVLTTALLLIFKRCKWI